MKYLIVALLLFLLTACGVTGTASKASFPTLASNVSFSSAVKDVKLFSGDDTANNDSIGAFNWGSFDEADKKLIRDAIYSTLDKNMTGYPKQANVYVRIHRYSQVITNASYASFVIVDWCLEHEGEILVDEVFYAGHSDDLNIFTGKSLGWAKGETHKAIATRIINRSLEALSASSLNNAYPETNIFLTAEEAVSKLPKELTSMGVMGASYYVGSQTGATNFDQKAIYQKVDWKSKIK